MKKRTFEYINVLSVEQIELLKRDYERNQRVSSVCSVCGDVKYTTLKRISFPVICKSCKLKQTNIERYGNGCPCNSESIKHKVEKTNLERYGFSNAASNSTIQKKSKDTILRNGGYSSIVEKRRETNISRHNNPTYNNCEQMIKTKTIRYGENWYLSLWGNTSKYKYDDIIFDSYWELAFYIFCISRNINVKRCEKPIEYVFENVKHYYYPDFQLSCGLVEIKGDHFFQGTKMICPYNRNKDALYEAKHQCMIRNGVTILKYKELKDIIREVSSTFPSLRCEKNTSL